MKRLLPLIGLLWALTASAPGAEPNTTVQLLLSRTQAKPGETITAALQMVSKPGWHTYWINPGDAGLSASIDWELPGGISAGALQFPVPEKMVIAKLHAYVYEGEVLLLMPLKIPSTAPPGPVQLQGTVNWLECSEKTCLPQDAKVSATFAIGAKSEPSASADLIAKWADRLPKPAAPFAVSASWAGPAQGDTRALSIEWAPLTEVGKPDFFPLPAGKFAVLGATEVLEASSNQVRLRKTVQLNEGEWPGLIEGLVLNNTAKGANPGYAAQLRPAGGGTGAAGSTTPAAIQLGGESGPRSIAGILLLAFLGGLILNVMPCVLPVIALKILGFVNQSRSEPARVRQLGIVYMLGVLASFLVLAGVLIGVKRATGAANWGLQMQNPYFVFAMTVLVTLVALNLFGVFEITLGSGAMGGATNLASREGRAGAFYNGVLATLLATPCTAPALGAAVGAVITQSPAVIILTFLTIGFGLALPYVLLSWNPRWLKFLPKPGAWMEKFKMAMGFPMLATAIWLLSIGARHYGKSGFLWLGLFLVTLSISAWIWGSFVQRGSRNRGFAMAAAAFFLAAGYYFALERQLAWREPHLAQESGEIEIAADGVPWQRWSAAAVADARAAGRPVLVDFTADWCLTCQLNKESLESDAVKRKLKELGAVPFLADFTLKDPKILEEIIRLGRGGVPVVAIYPADPAAPPIVLPEFLTPDTVLEGLALASAPKLTSASRP